VLLRPPPAASELGGQLLKDRVKYLTALLRQYSGTSEECVCNQRYFLQGQAFEFDFQTLATIDDVDRMLPVFDLFAAILQNFADFLLVSVVTTERLCDLLADAIAGGEFAVKKRAIKFLSELLDSPPAAVGMIGKIVADSRFFECAPDVVESGFDDLRIEYLAFLRRLLLNITQMRAVRRIFVWQAQDAELDDAVRPLVRSDNPEVKDLAEKVCVALQYAEMSGG
jgi:hypothetical protein